MLRFPLGAHQLYMKDIRKDMMKKSCYTCKQCQAKKNRRIMSQSKIAGRSVAWQALIPLVPVMILAMFGQEE